MNTLVGKTLVGEYKAPGKEPQAMAVEVHAEFANADRDNEPMLVVVRKDLTARGSVGALYLHRFFPDTLVVKDTPDFKPLPGLAEGEWYLTPISLQYAQVERVRTESGLKHLPKAAVQLKFKAEAPAA